MKSALIVTLALALAFPARAADTGEDIAAGLQALVDLDEACDLFRIDWLVVFPTIDGDADQKQLMVDLLEQRASVPPASDAAPTGDAALTDRWLACAKLVSRIRRDGLRNQD